MFLPLQSEVLWAMRHVPNKRFNPTCAAVGFGVK